VGKLVTPEVYLVGYTCIDAEGLGSYLADVGAGDFVESIRAAKEQRLSDGEILCSMYAKLCYKSLVLGQNLNVTRVRDIPDNLKACFSQGHGSVFEHCQLNFIVTNCSRVFTHELVRHRVGTAFSQTSGRYVRGDEVDIVFDPILEPVRKEVKALQSLIEERYRLMVKKMGLDDMKDFGLKKKVTSALRRLLPNGQSNEIGFSTNLRALRHLVQMRTSRSAEWEIRLVFARVYDIVKTKYPMLFADAHEETVEGILEVSGMRMQPYEQTTDGGK
jgi:thymidylate synthase (FAD)